MIADFELGGMYRVTYPKWFVDTKNSTKILLSLSVGDTILIINTRESVSRHTVQLFAKIVSRIGIFDNCLLVTTRCGSQPFFKTEFLGFEKIKTLV